MAKIIVRGSDSLKLGYELTNIQLEYKIIDNINLAGKHFMNKHVTYTVSQDTHSK